MFRWREFSIPYDLACFSDVFVKYKLRRRVKTFAFLHVRVKNG